MPIFSRSRQRPTRPRPVSISGLWLRTHAKGAPAGAERYTRVTDVDAAEGVMQAAFALAAHRRFPADRDRREVTNVVTELMARYSPKGLRSIDAETLIREALGEQVSTAGIDERSRILTWALFTPDLLAQSKLSDDELDDLLCAAEETAIGQGLTLERPA